MSVRPVQGPSGPDQVEGGDRIRAKSADANTQAMAKTAP